MTVDELKKMSNSKILFDTSNGSLLLRSIVYRYADFLNIEKIDSIEKNSDVIVRITIPSGSAMGDHDISVNLDTGIVTADGKVYDEPMPEGIQKAVSKKGEKTKKPSSSRFNPSINGFSIRSVQTMPSEDGYACYCKVYFNNRKVGDFVDKGDGGEYSFYADQPYSRSKIEDIIRSFPPTNRDYGLGPMEIPYDMNQMVNDLMEMKEISKALKRSERSGRDYVLIDEWKTNRHFTCTPPKTMDDDKLAENLRNDLSKRGVLDYEVRRFSDLEDLTVVNAFVCEDILS